MNARHVFHINTDTGTWSQVSAPFMGSIRQVRWAPGTSDTGGSLEMALLPNENDTGDGFTFLTKSGMNSAFVDTGVNVIGAGDRFKVKATPGGSSLAGRLYVWTDNRGD